MHLYIIYIRYSIKIIFYLPFRTCTRILEISAFDGAHEYFPESGKSASCMSRYDVVVSPFCVCTDIPPLAES